MNLPIPLLLLLKHTHRLTAFLETGTAGGDSALLASTYFPRVFTVEIDRERFQHARNRLRANPSIHITCDSSPGFIRHILSENPTERFLFWLDGHWCGGPRFGKECPLMDELAAIAPHHSNHAILIDDARLFLSPPPPPHIADDWPTMSEIQSYLQTWKPVPNSYVQNDVIVIEPIIS
jgi:hypothetical protein